MVNAARWLSAIASSHVCLSYAQNIRQTCNDIEAQFSDAGDVTTFSSGKPSIIGSSLLNRFRHAWSNLLLLKTCQSHYVLLGSGECHSQSSRVGTLRILASQARLEYIYRLGFE
ncbi:hypothetical protein Slin15195_G128860 [Septoria linicola]|uniref:Uncharacterized protein n=1 Tax=Septoria linicola TaxID=215465 RepID=A0A9Q9ER62_9PEZI|nr:hypothetical protein Slin15195_G128860 [Septoria linicola]